jgi:anaphase-promoting complex subunit 1
MNISATTTKGLPNVNLPHVRFGSDRRVAEVERILQTTRVRTIQIEDPKGISEQDIVHYHQSVVNTIANRTLAITVGSGIFEYGTRRTTVTETWDIPPIELSIKVLPVNTVIKAIN